MMRGLLGSLLIAIAATVVPSIQADAVPWLADQSEQLRQYAADVPKSVVELQAFRRTQVQPAVDANGRRGTATLIDLNPRIGVWYLLGLDWGDGQPHWYHLENPVPGQHLALDARMPDGLLLQSDGAAFACALWSGAALQQAGGLRNPYAPLCEGRLLLHNTVRGHSSSLEAVVEFLRRHVPAAEHLINAAKQTVLEDAGRESAEFGAQGAGTVQAPTAPAAVRLAADYQGREIGRGSLGIGVGSDAPLRVGHWIAVPERPGIFVALMTPQAIAPEILQGYRNRASALDARESAALVYAVAFDLGRFDLGFGLGTDHPAVDWSPRPPASVRPPSLPGPDGIETVRPIVTTGMIPPQDRDRTVAAFVGGFKRYHGAFKYGALSQRNRGSHYGFVQEGVVLSKLQPGLSTLYVLNDGSVHMGAWTEADDSRLAEIRYARQNGVPLVEWDVAADAPVPGELVNQWGGGNWSGSAEGALRTVRGGACLQKTAETRYLIYAYFSSATPSAMARVFQAFGCEHAMQLDINAPILTYLALYARGGGALRVEYLVQAMVEAEQKVGGQPVPRFLVMPDNRDFFYLMQRKGEAR